MKSTTVKSFFVVIALVLPLVRGAGGVITDWQGGDPHKGTSIVAANPNLHPQVIEILNG